LRYNCLTLAAITAAKIIPGRKPLSQDAAAGVNAHRDGAKGLKKYVYDYLFLFSIAGVLILLDQWTKSLVRANLDMSEIYRPELWISQYVRIVHWTNYGAAFGIFQNFSTVFAVLSSIVSLLIIYYFPQTSHEDFFVRLAMGILLGGAVGNLIDRLTRGYVTDFVSVGTFPVFNVADASISTGVAVLFVGMWLQDRQKARQQAAALQAAEGTTAGEEPPGE
jgi:signal peptidase II